jgi:hypothetical protein
VIIYALQIYDHVALRFVVTDALNEAAPIDVPALERFEVDWAAILHVNRFRPN